jgi:hypothetical protein
MKKSHKIHSREKFHDFFDVDRDMSGYAFQNFFLERNSDSMVIGRDFITQVIQRPDGFAFNPVLITFV